MNQKLRLGSLSVLLSLVGGGLLISPAQAVDAPRAVEQDTGLDILLTQKARDILERVRLVDGQARSRRVEVSADIANGVVTVALERVFLPADYGPSFEDQRSEISFGLLHWAERAAPFSRVVFLYDGKEIEYYFPEIKAADDAAREAGEALRRTRGTPGSGMAFVAAGHGYFYSYKDNRWVTSRDEWNGVSEGLLTPSYAADLKAMIEQRSQMPVIRPRVQITGTTHPPSGEEWWTIAARYAIAEQYPAETKIWNTYAGSTLWDREEREDINSRPLLANHHGAEVAIHLHSNGEPSGAARGTRVIVQPGRPMDAALAESVLCSMKELIHSLPEYAAFTVAPAPHALDKGENREAHMPSIIVETAFHTNPDDAKALQDPVFRLASMKGVEKGYRLWASGKTCEPLALHPVPDTDVPIQAARDIELGYAGNPQYPVSVELSLASCSEEGASTPSATTFDDPAKPLTINLACNGPDPGVARWSAVLRDADGVATAPVEFSQACVRA
ncbi:N-acetylmuramoyl-L-alanine amidase family protein [Stenotrophomonas maltophilia]|uniref:N-acetylmuramoyl-L-alanine amidase family protein n=1 Tax=Stenotrophomonas maltophilia TaxID=40324 RepID=UPI0021C98A48|nr:N-acetylmuramoyl-L-alanine amidase [Stenotrophomonas maltophilia]MCU1207590.1 N-acetylmuramoyl-L-alanine amidase [Stenotrophomonas maltophilia]